ncbi:MAG: hypothetical protein M3Q16_02885 [Pseudomonadota bacterium]|nr:hypothetical protein [Pseudomonadota bacterium]
MKYLSNRKKALLIAYASPVILCLSGMVHAQAQNPLNESQKSVITEKKSANKAKAANKTKGADKKQSKQGSRKEAENYEGAQPPQGGRLGQGPE